MPRWPGLESMTLLYDLVVEMGNILQSRKITENENEDIA
jgi:hypothetical protein